MPQVFTGTTCCPGSGVGGTAVHHGGSAPLEIVCFCQRWEWKTGLSLDGKGEQSPGVLDWPDAERGDQGHHQTGLWLETLGSAEDFVPAPDFRRALCNSHSIPVCWAEPWRGPPQALPSSCQSAEEQDTVIGTATSRRREQQPTSANHSFTHFNSPVGRLHPPLVFWGTDRRTNEVRYHRFI